MKKAQQKTRWFFPVVTADDARDAIKIAYKTVFAVAGIQAVVLIIFSWMSGSLSADVFDPVLMAALAMSMKSRRSRLAASVLFGYSLPIGVITLLARLGSPVTDFGGKNVILAVLFIYASYKGVQGTFGYHRIHRTKTSVRNVVKLTLIILGYVIGVTIVYFGLFFVPASMTAFEGMSDELIGSIWLVPVAVLIFFGCLGWLPGTHGIQVTQRLEPLADNHSGDSDHSST